jgi:hypothetical protein
MGIDRYFADFLLCARENGADFRRTATLGRLNLFADVRSLRDVFCRHGETISDADIRRIRSGSGGYVDEFLRALGAKDLSSIDASSYEGASCIHDMNLPIPGDFKQKFSVVIDGGTLEHVFHFPTAIRNCMEMLEVGGHLLIHTMANNFMGHGFYQFSPELFYRVLSEENGFRIHRAVVFESRIGRPRWYEAADPKQIGERVELTNARPTYLMVHAERIAEVPIFATPPHQADYSALWSENEAPQFSSAGLRGKIHRWARSHNDVFLKWLPGAVYDVALSALVRGLPRRGFARRHYAMLKRLKG